MLPAEAEAIDAAQFAAVDGDAGGIWAPASPIQVGGAGLTAVGLLSSTGGLSVTGTASLSGSGAVTDLTGGAKLRVNTGCEVDLESGGSLVVKSGAIAYVASGATLNLLSGGLMNVVSGAQLAVGGTVEVQSGGHLTLDSGATLEVDAGAELNIGGIAEVQSGAELVARSGGTMLVESGGYLSVAAGGHTLLAAADVSLTGAGNPSYATPRAFADMPVEHSALPIMGGGATAGPHYTGYVIANTTGGLGMILRLPRGATITRLTLEVANIGLTWPRGSAPKIDLYQTPLGSLAQTLVGSATDATPNLGAYSATHELALDVATGGLPGAGLVVNPTSAYALFVSGDSSNIVTFGVPRITGTLATLRVV